MANWFFALSALAALLLAGVVVLALLLARTRRRGEDAVQPFGQESLQESLAALRAELVGTRPCVLQIALDGADELRQTLRESARVELLAGVEGLLEEWAASLDGLLAKLDEDRFLLLAYTSALELMIAEKFPILDAVRGYRYRDRREVVTISVGVGQGGSFAEAEANSRQALDMALGRGGDQAAVKHPDLSYAFFGGVSQQVEKTGKVQVRTMAMAFAELMRGSDRVYVMGHRNSDLDCLGAAAGVCALARAQGKPAYIVLDPARTMAGRMMERLREEQSARFLTPRQAQNDLSARTLLILVDTHIAERLESPALCEQARQLAIIDHHRRAVNYIQNAVVFYHDPGVSSASELVTELIQYTTPAPQLSPTEADALLAGIHLDTRGFVLHAGAAAFTAAAFLRGQGADTVRVRKLFAGGQEDYRRRMEIVSGAEIAGRCAVSAVRGEGAEDPNRLRLLCSQAADELLNLEGVDAAFVLFEDGGQIHVSARSLGAVNVQVLMERLGGGGHQTMAAAQLDGAQETLDSAEAKIWTVLEER
ncbi:MAG: DHH family phosphoesterase [Oscillospiraceae bacterium]|nr:DHH family phosphoesterase [Oscillospiraceae bacterium]